MSFAFSAVAIVVDDQEIVHVGGEGVVSIEAEVTINCATDIPSVIRK